MKELESWLENEDYLEGIDLLKSHEGSSVLIAFLERGENAFARKKLRLAIADLVGSKPVDPEPQTNQEIPSKASKYPPEAISLFKERSELHTLLKHQTNDADRAKLAFRIKALCKRIELVLGGQNTSKEVTKTEIPDSPGGMMKMLNRNRPYISKYKNDPMKAGEVSRRRQENLLIEQKLGLS